MVPLGGGFLDAQGRPILVPAQTDTLADRIVRQEFADENRARNARHEAARAIEIEEREASPDWKPRPRARPLSFVEMRLAEEKNRGRARGAMIDTRTAEPTSGPVHDAQTLDHIKHVDRIAASFDRLDRAEALQRHRAAFGDPVGSQVSAGDGDE
jgi:hypothetical protein